MHNIIPSNHLLVASSQRVLALILEEIAIDELANPVDKIASKGMLAHAEKLHLSAVSLSTKAFGEKNVQTAKHYILEKTPIHFLMSNSIYNSVCPKHYIIYIQCLKL